MTIDELLAQLEREATLGWHGVSQPQPYDQMSVDAVALCARAMRLHPGAS